LESYLIRLKLQFQPSYEAVLDEVIAKREAQKALLGDGKDCGELSEDEEARLNEGEIVAVDSTDDEFGLSGLRKETQKWR
jgi:hypothetical protein